MRNCSPLSILLSTLLPIGLAFGQAAGDWEIPVLSELVGTTIDLAEQEYYAVFDDVDKFLTGQFLATESGFIATIRTENGVTKRHYTARQFYDIGLSIDLLGDIDPVRLADLRGEPQFAETMVKAGALMTDVVMTIYQRSGKLVKGRYIGMIGHRLQVRNRRSGVIHRVSIGEIDYLKYREPPVIEVLGDKRIFGIMAGAGMVFVLGVDVLAGIDGFSRRGRHTFMGGLGGLVLAPIPLKQVRRLRGEVVQVEFDRSIIDKVRTYLFLTFGET